MNTLESYFITNPYGKNDECSKFIIDDVTDPFIMSNTTTLQREYTFGMWVKSDVAGSITIYTTDVETTTEWKYYSITFTATGTNLPIRFNVVGTYYVYHPQLEIGNKPSDWTPAPEDVDQNILDAEARTNEAINDKETSILATSESIILSALESYVQNGDYEAFKSNVEAQLSVMSDEIKMTFTSTNEKITELDGEFQSEITELYKHISFSENGVSIQAGEGTMQLVLDNDIISFQKNGEQFGWWDGVDFHTGNIVVDITEKAQFGNFANVPRSDHSMHFLKVSGPECVNLALGTGGGLVIEESDEPRAVFSTPAYPLSSTITDDPKAFLYSLKDGYSLVVSYDINFQVAYANPDYSLNRAGVYICFRLTRSDGTITDWYGPHTGPTFATEKHSFITTNSLVNFTDDAKSYVGHYSCYTTPSLSTKEGLVDFYANPDNYTVEVLEMRPEFRGYTTGGSITNIKLERGVEDTGWSPAPEDILEV